MSQPKQIRLCMIGAGQHASDNVYPNFRFVKNAQVVANADLDENKARTQATLHGIPRSYTDYREMLRTEKPDGVIVVVGPGFHAKAAVEILELGYHVYTEKPGAQTLAESRAILAAHRKSGKIAMTAFKKRFAPAYQKARKIIASGDFGAPALLTVLRTKGYSPQKDTGQADYLLPWGCHAIDLVTYLFGNVAQVSALQSAGTTHAYAVNLRYANGALGQLAVTDRAGPVWEEATAIGGNMMTVRVQNSIQMTAYKGDQPCAAHSPEFSCGSRQGSIEQGFVGELQEFADAIAEGRQPESNIVQATHSMAVYEAIKRSAQTNSIVNVEDL